MRACSRRLAALFAFGALVTSSPLAGAGQTRGVEVPAPDTCPVTTPSAPVFTPPAPYPPRAPSPDRFWYGTNGLWTMPFVDGTWRGLALPDGSYRDKVFWWREGYSGPLDPTPDLTVTGRRLDGDAREFSISPATNAHAAEFGGWTMLTGVNIPTVGCWEIRGIYGNELVSFVVWIAP